MRPGLELRLSQQLRLSPQLRQALKLLQLSQVELEIELREQLESNPVLEMDEPPEPVGDLDASGSIDADTAHESPAPGEHDHDDSDYDPGLDLAPEHTDHEWPTGDAGGTDSDPVDWASAPPDDLAAHLLWQIRLSPIGQRDLAIAAAIIEALDDDGYLRIGLHDIAQTLKPDINARIDEIEAVRHRIQQLDPAGVASCDLRECLLVQLDLLDEESEGLAQARGLVSEHIEKLPKTDRTQLARLLGTNEATIDAAIALIRSLDPKPGARFDAAPPEYIQPDVYVVRSGESWHAVLYSDRSGQLRINRDYLQMAKDAGRDTRSYLRGCLQEARWLLRALQQRQETLFRVASAIVDAQQAFFDQGPQAMRPLMLKDIAAKLGLHESTVSRTVARKYMHTPRGLIELRQFFSTGYTGGGDGDAAATAVRALIGELIAAENASKPLSDQIIAEMLKQRGLNVARRTVAKYREQLRILPSHERRRA